MDLEQADPIDVVLRAISERVGDIATAVLFAGAVQLARKFDGAYAALTDECSS